MSSKYLVSFDCPVLATHNKKFEEQSPFKNIDNLEIPSLFRFFNSYNLEIYSGSMESLSASNQIKGTQVKELHCFLENLAPLYLAALRKTGVSYFFSDRLIQLSRLESQAKTLRKNLQSLEDVFEELEFILKMNNLISENEVPSNYLEIHRQLVLNLIEIENVSATIKSSELGEQFKIGVRGRKGNPENQLWVSYMRDFWFHILRRNFDHDPNGVNGRARFLSFAEDCLNPLHPNAKEDQIRKTLDQLEKDERRHLPK